MVKLIMDKGGAIGKRGQVEYLLQNVFRIAFLTIALLAFFLLINMYINNKLDAQALQAETIANRIIYSDTIMYNDPNTGRVYPGILDINKFNSAQLDKGINFGQYSRYTGVKLKLLNKNPDPTKQFIADAYINEQQYNNLKQLLGFNGKEASTMYIKQYPVTYLDIDGTYHYATLVIEIILQNS